MAKFDGILICTDVDGTFAEGYNICADNAEYVRYFQENGGRFTVVTGRPYKYVDGFENFRPNCPVITHNGAIIYDLEKQAVLFEKPLAKDIDDIAEYILRHPLVTRVIMHGMDFSHDIADTAQINNDTEYYKIVLCTEQEDAAVKLRNSLKEKFGHRFCIFRAWDTGIECLASDTNKGTAVKRLCGILTEDIKKLICVGDSENDSFMLRAADIGYAVENAAEEAKQAADRITVHYKQGAIAQIIKDLEAEL